MTLEAPRRLIAEPYEGWSAADVTPDEYVDDEWISENTKVVSGDGLDQGNGTEGS